MLIRLNENYYLEIYNVVHRFGLISLRGGRLPQKISGPSSPYIYTHPTKNHLKPG